MQFKTTKPELLKTIQKVQTAISSKGTLPILSNVLLEAGKESLKTTATDLDIGISCTIPIDTETIGAITLPAKKFFDIIKELPDTGDINISTKKK